MMTPQQTILLIEDDQDAQEIVKHHLEKEGYNILIAADGRTGLKQLHEEKPDLVLLDINMPDMDGYSVCERIRGLSTVPIIMLTALGQPEEVVRGLDLGADDYIVKPYNKDVLLARTRANLRRIQYEPPPSSSNDNSIYSDGYLTINLKDRRVKIDQEPVKLSPTEFGLLEVLFQERPRVVPYRNLLERVWGFEYIDDIDYLRVYIWHLRHKLEPNPKEPTYIHNELGVGYRFEGVK